jgi:3-oxocholest-4-en-26-oyl-CoA dehydrogenase alpha subunit
MDFRLPAAAEAFRGEVCRFLDGLLTPEFLSDPAIVQEGGFSRPFTRALGERGWLTMAWPKEYGGQARSIFDQVVYNEEMAARGVPGRAHMMAVSLVGPSIMIYGNDEQKARFLPAIARGEIVFCQGFSEPNAGSDLAGLQLAARRNGDEWVVNGTKIWTSDAHRADFCWLGARTDPDAPKHKGISTFVVPMDTPGITVSPLLTMGGHHHFNQVFFDNVTLPATALVGEENRGWYHMTTTLDFERSGAGTFAAARRLLQRIVDFYRDTARARMTAVGAEMVRLRLADLAVAVNVGSVLSYRVAWLQAAGRIPNYEASMVKLYGASLNQVIANTAVAIAGPAGQLTPDDARAPLAGAIEDGYVWSAAATIRGGTNEVQKNIIATRGLGLPRT